MLLFFARSNLADGVSDVREPYISVKNAFPCPGSPAKYGSRTRQKLSKTHIN